MKAGAIGVFLFSSVVFIAIMAVAVAVPFDDSLPPESNRSVQRKQGDMAVSWYGMSRVRSGRLGSVGNRSYRGGGLHGGK